MSILYSNVGGTIVRPAKLLCSRLDGGHLVVNPPRDVWERSCLSAIELAQWALLVAATGRAMLETLPVLEGGCINYWEAGNWALNDLAAPAGPKNPQQHRRVHLHVLGRTRQGTNPDWQWGESPNFGTFLESGQRAAKFSPLTTQEIDAVIQRVSDLMKTRYSLSDQSNLKS